MQHSIYFISVPKIVTEVSHHLHAVLILLLDQGLFLDHEVGQVLSAVPQTRAVQHVRDLHPFLVATDLQAF